MTDNRGEDNGCEKPYHCALINLVLASIRFFDVNVKNKKYCNKVRCLKLFLSMFKLNFNTYLKQLTYDSINAYGFMWVLLKQIGGGGGGERGPGKTGIMTGTNLFYSHVLP